MWFGKPHLMEVKNSSLAQATGKVLARAWSMACPIAATEDAGFITKNSLVYDKNI